MNNKNNSTSNPSDEDPHTVLIVSLGAYIMKDPRENFESFSIEFEEHNFEIHNIIRLSPLNWRPRGILDIQNMSKVSPDLRFPNIPCFSILPKVSSDTGQLLLEERHETDSEYATEYPDTLIIFCNNGNKKYNTEIVCKQFVSEWTRWLRILSKQYWIGRSFDFGVEVVNKLPVTRDMKIGHEITSLSNNFYVSGLDILNINNNMLIHAARQFKNGVLPNSIDILNSDLNFYLSIGQFETAIIQCCCVIELCRNSKLKEFSISKSKMRMPPNDLLKHLSSGFENIFDRNLLKEDAVLF